jgi:ABC-2 type transport system ATP-binding protein
MDVLTATALRKRFGTVTAVDGVGFSVGPGQIVGLHGPNGAGKTTTLHMVCSG